MEGDFTLPPPDNHLGLIGEILDVDKIESGNYQLQPQWVDIPTLVQNTCHFSLRLLQANRSH